MSNWKNKLKNYMEPAVRFCAKTKIEEGMAPTTELNREEFFGCIVEGVPQMGFFDHVCSIIQDERKRCYQQGFLDGAKGSLEDLRGKPEGELVVDEQSNKIISERRFHEWRD